MSSEPELVLAVHAGAGRIDPDASRRQAQTEGLRRSLEVGRELLVAGGSALDVVERAVRELEDCAEFNAGRGSVLTAEGSIEVDAAIASGSGRAGGVAALRRVRNPIVAARAVLEHGSHLLIAGAGAEDFARASGIELCPESALETEYRRGQLEAARIAGRVILDHQDVSGGTVGAVARDARGELAAATSTGGMTNQLPGRVGDTPLIGAGTWADDATCAVSGTGSGEAFMRIAFAHEIDALVRLAGQSLEEACQHALDRVGSVGASGGCIAVGPTGPPVLLYNTRDMARGQLDSSGHPDVRI